MPALPWNSYYVTLGLLAVCTIVGIGVAIRFRREVDDDLAPTTAKDLLDPLEKAYYSGLMHPSEIERIRESVKKSSLSKGSPPKASAKPAKAVDPTVGLNTIDAPEDFVGDNPAARSPDGGHQADAG